MRSPTKCAARAHVLRSKRTHQSSCTRRSVIVGTSAVESSHARTEHPVCPSICCDGGSETLSDRTEPGHDGACGGGGLPSSCKGAPYDVWATALVDQRSLASALFSLAASHTHRGSAGPRPQRPPPPPPPKVAQKCRPSVPKARERNFVATGGGNNAFSPHVSVLEILRILWRIQSSMKVTEKNFDPPPLQPLAPSRRLGPPCQG